MSYDNNNIFARILRGELPCHKVYEDEHSLAFLDIMPQANGHTLVLPKEAAVVITELSPAALQATMLTVHKLARAVQTAAEAPGLMLAQLNGPAAGQTVPHVHFHLIPRFDGVDMRLHAREPADPAQLAAMAEKVIAALKAQQG